MTRRTALSLAAAPAALAAQSAAPGDGWIEMRYFHLRNSHDNQRQRMTEWLIKGVLPALKRAGAGPVGYFSSSIGEQTPYLLEVVGYASLDALIGVKGKLQADEEFGKQALAFYSQPGLEFTRMESRLLRSIAGMPQIEVPAGDASRPARIFELRTYESDNGFALAKKVGMFENGEIAIFRKTGLNPVFFGTTEYGPRMPNLTYMLWYESLAAREANWRTFAGHPEWIKLRATPGLSDAEVVSNISNSILTPLAGSPIR